MLKMFWPCQSVFVYIRARDMSACQILSTSASSPAAGGAIGSCLNTLMKEEPILFQRYACVDRMYRAVCFGATPLMGLIESTVIRDQQVSAL